jgi:hypothetical protein
MSDTMNDALDALLAAQDNRRDALTAHARATMTTTTDALVSKAKYRLDIANAELKNAIARYNGEVKRYILAQRTELFSRGTYDLQA